MDLETDRSLTSPGPNATFQQFNVLENDYRLRVDESRTLKKDKHSPFDP